MLRGDRSAQMDEVGVGVRVGTMVCCMQEGCNMVMYWSITESV